jgi:hypothetical protein
VIQRNPGADLWDQGSGFSRIFCKKKPRRSLCSAHSEQHRQDANVVRQSRSVFISSVASQPPR